MAEPFESICSAGNRSGLSLDRRDILKWSSMSLVGGSTAASGLHSLPDAVLQTRENTLTVTKEGAETGRAAFAVTVSGDITSLEDSEAVVQGSSALDWVGPEGGTDTLQFTGEITQFLFKGRATVRLNGDQVNPSDLGTDGGTGQESGNLENTVTVTKEGAEDGLGAFAVWVSGMIEAAENEEAVVQGDRAMDWVGPNSGSDELRFSGEITRFLFKGEAVVRLNGEEIDPGSLGTPTTGFERIRPPAEVSVRPGVETVFEVKPGSDVDPFDVELDVGEEMTYFYSQGPFTPSYESRPENLAFYHRFDSPGTYTATATSGDGDSVEWTVQVADDGMGAPTGEWVSPASMEQVDESPVELSADVRAPSGNLDRVIWWLGMADDVLGRTSVSGQEDTATHTVEPSSICDGCPLCFRVVTENGIASELDCLDSGASDDGDSGQGEVTARVVDMNGEPLSGAHVWIYDNEGLELLEEADSGDDGRLPLSQEYGDVLWVARSNQLFRSVRSALGEGTELSLDKELLFGPTVASTVQNEALGVVSVWRWFGSDPREQVLFVEVANTQLSEPYYEIQQDSFDLSSGYFSVAVPEETVLVDYGSFDSVDSSLSQGVGIVGTNTPETAGPSPVSRIHPIRDDGPGVPLQPVASRMGLGVGFYTIDQKREELSQEASGRLIETLPIVGTAATWVDTIDWGFGDLFDKEASLGPSSVDPLDPNEVDTVFEGWDDVNDGSFGHASVQYIVPLVFSTNESVDIRVQAEWTMDAAIGEGSGQFVESFNIAPDV